MNRHVLLTSAMALIAAACASASDKTSIAQSQQPKVEAAPTAPKLDRKTSGYVQQMLVYSMQIRTGRYEVGNEAVKTMEAAVAADPANAELHTLLGGAYSLQAMAIDQTKYAELFGLLGKAYAEHARALELDPDNVTALGGHGSLAVIFSFIRAKPELADQGIAEMNRAVALSKEPDLHVQQLLRALTTINLPAPKRAFATEKADFAALFARSEGMNQGDMIRVISGDVSIEAGDPAAARAAYTLAAKSPRPGGDLARKRLAALDTGGVKPADISQLRADIAKCTACHGT
jgi:tetratricopeptide (TPR) repeat protein